VTFPATMADMLRGGYVFLQTKECRDCSALIYMFRTPKKRTAPFVKTPRGRFVSHFAVCPAARKRDAKVSHLGQGELFRSENFSPLGMRGVDERPSDAA
jgi:hypothetical protein